MTNETEYFQCECHSDDHTFKLEIDSDDGQLILTPYLRQSGKFWHRVAAAFKFIFNERYGLGYWDCVLVKNEDVERLKGVIDKAYFRQVDLERLKRALTPGGGQALLVRGESLTTLGGTTTPLLDGFEAHRVSEQKSVDLES